MTMIQPTRLSQQLRHQAHRYEQPARLSLQGEEAVVPMKLCSAFVFGIDHYRHCGNLIGMFQAAAQGIQKQMFSEALALGGLIDGQPAQQGDG